MRRLFIDTTVLTFALGNAHPAQEGCRHLLQSAAAGEVELHASTEAIQELLHHRMRRGPRTDAISETRVAAEVCRLHAFDALVLTKALELVELTTVRGRDAVHAASAVCHGFDHIVSLDSDFDGIVGLRRVDPADALA